MKRICLCGVEFKTAQSRIDQGRGKYCSRKCMYNYRVRPSGLKYNIVMQNPTWFFKGSTPHNKGIPCTAEQIQRLKETHKGKRYSPRTEFKYRNGNGYRHLLYKGILSQQCAQCDETNIKRLHIHHIDHNRANNDISNFRVLCRPCHLSLHGRTERVYVEGTRAVLNINKTK